MPAGSLAHSRAWLPCSHRRSRRTPRPARAGGTGVATRVAGPDRAADRALEHGGGAGTAAAPAGAAVRPPGPDALRRLARGRVADARRASCASRSATARAACGCGSRS